jgi:hypothetical protein
MKAFVADLASFFMALLAFMAFMAGFFITFMAAFFFINFMAGFFFISFMAFIAAAIAERDELFWKVEKFAKLEPLKRFQTSDRPPLAPCI